MTFEHKVLWGVIALPALALVALAMIVILG